MIAAEVPAGAGPGTTRRFLTGAAALCLAAACEGTTPPAPPPPPPPPASVPFAAVAAGQDHTCALGTDGAAHCWGRAVTGALGVDTVASSALYPTPVSTSLRFDSITAGSGFTCALTAQGKAYCWGAGTQGQLGAGTRTGSRVPVAVADTARLTMLRAGGAHACALGGDSLMYCWGRGADGELGDLMVRDSAAPARPVGDPQNLYIAVVAGLHHACGLTRQGEARCWGWNAFGQLGIGSTVGLGGPVAVRGTLRFSRLTAGRDFTCGLRADGSAFCWGRNDFGQLGTGAFERAYEPTRVDGPAFVALTAGGTHACGLAVSGAAYCWGSNSDGQLGTGSVGGSEPKPVLVAGTSRFDAISAGGLHTCARTADAGVYCWGFGGFGQLGDGFALTRSAPTRVVGR